MSGGRAAAGLCAVAFVVGSLLSLRLGRGGWRVVYVRRCGSGGAFCFRRTSSVAVLLWRLALGSHPALRLWRGVRRAVHVQRCGLDAAVGAQFTSGGAALVRCAARDSRSVLRFCCGDWRSIHIRHCGSGGAFCFRHTSGVAALAGRFVLGSRLLFDALRQTGRLAISCVPVPPGRDRHSCVLAVSVRLSAFVGSLRACTFLCGDLDGLPEYGRTGEREDGATGLAARPLCAFAQAHRLCNSFRGEYVGAARPKPAPKSLRLSGLSSRCGGVMLVQIPIPTKSASAPISAPTLAKPGYTGRPARL